MYPETNTLPKQPYPVRSAAGLVDWDNLVPTCKKCNVQKSAHDTVKEPIIDPYKDDPERVFEYDGLFIKAKTGAMAAIAQKTIDVCKLNEGRLLNQRADILVALRALEQNLGNAISNNISARNLQESLSIINAFEQPEQKLAGFCRAFLRNSKSYQSAKTIAAGGAECQNLLDLKRQWRI
jgi:hypothetical protein